MIEAQPARVCAFFCKLASSKNITPNAYIFYYASASAYLACR